jgi:ABC-type Fe3+-hydroxamate transport system substrate-binding protein
MHPTALKVLSLALAAASLLAARGEVGATSVGALTVERADFQDRGVTVVTASSGVVSASLLSDELLEGVLPWESWLAVSHVVDWPSATPASRLFPSKIRRTSGSTEDIFSLQPKLVLLSEYNNALTHAQLNSLGIVTHVVLTPRCFEDLFEQIEVLGERVGQEQNAQEKVSQINTRLESLRATTPPDGERPTALLLQGMFSYGPSTLQGRCLEEAGFRNVLSDPAQLASPSLNIEFLLSADPEYIFMASDVSSPRRHWGDGAPLPPSSGTLEAVAQGNVWLVPGSWMASISHHALLACEAYAEARAPTSRIER